MRVHSLELSAPRVVCSWRAVAVSCNDALTPVFLLIVPFIIDAGLCMLRDIQPEARGFCPLTHPYTQTWRARFSGSLFCALS